MLYAPFFILLFSEEQRQPRIESPPAEREASGSPPEGGDNFRKAPMGLFTRHQTPTPIVFSRAFLVLECICVWLLHPIQARWHNTLWPKSVVLLHVFCPARYDGSALRFCLLKIRLKRRCCTWAAPSGTCGCDLASNALLTTPLTLPTQIPQYLSNSGTKFAVQLLLPISGNKYDVVFAIPSDMR